MTKFHQPKTVEELVALASHMGEHTYFISGGTDLVVGLHQAGFHDGEAIDISLMEGWNAIEDLGDTIRIGCNATMTDMSRSELLKKWCYALTVAGGMMGSTQVRNRATLGGNIMNAAQCCDTLPVLYAYDAELEVIDLQGETFRKPIRTLVTGICETTLPKGHIVRAIHVKKRPNQSGFWKIGSRKTVTISKLNGCVLVEPGADKPVTVYLGAVGVKPLHANILEEAIMVQGHTGCTESVLEAASLQVDDAIPTRDSRHYKRVAIKGLVEDMLEQVGEVEL